MSFTFLSRKHHCWTQFLALITTIIRMEAGLGITRAKLTNNGVYFK